MTKSVTLISSTSKKRVAGFPSAAEGNSQEVTLKYINKKIFE
jgi:hypothetical protein